jgi:hypothetical protein
MSNEIMHQILEAIEIDVRSRPSAIEFEMAYQARVAVDRIRFAIKHVEQFASPCEQMREANLQLLDALERLQSLDRRFQVGLVLPTTEPAPDARGQRGPTEKGKHPNE